MRGQHDIHRNYSSRASSWGALLATKVALGICAGFLLGHLIGERPIRAGWFAGVSTLAVVAAINDTNGGLYITLMGQFGRSEDAGAYSMMALESGPFFTMVTLGVAGLSGFPWQTLVGAILPLAAGVTLGNLDPDLRDFLSKATPVLIPFFAFALGATLNLHRVWQAGLVGIAMGIAIVLLSGASLIAVDRLIGGDGTAGIAPQPQRGMLLSCQHWWRRRILKYAEAAGPATALVASCVTVSALLVPHLPRGGPELTGRTEFRQEFR